MKQQSCGGFYGFFKRPLVSPLEKIRNRQHDIWCLITNTWANRVAIVSSVITKIFNPCKNWTVMIQPSVLLCSVNQFIRILCQFFCYCYQCHSILFCFVWFTFVWLFSVQFFVYSVLFFCPVTEMYSRYFDPYKIIKQLCGKSINIIHQTAP